MHYKLGNIHDEYLMISTLKIVISSIVAGAGSFVTLYILAPVVGLQTYWGVFTQGVGAALVGIMIYLFFTYVLGLSETLHLIKLLRTTGQKIGRPINIIYNWFN